MSAKFPEQHTNPVSNEVETPMKMAWMSDTVAEILRRMDIPYIALNPGASYRGLHDSLVNYLDNKQPQMLTTLHEEHAVAMAHGYAKVTGRAMAVALHSNVGLMHATMAIYNAWVDRAPIIMLGATGPVDANLRRPWIDWIHTSRDQGALIRHYVKWDDQPSSVAATLESVLRGRIIAETLPKGPVYICLDSALQESPLEAQPEIPDLSRFQARQTPVADAQLLDQAAQLLDNAKLPVILLGRVGQSREAWNARVELAERLGAKVITDVNTAAGFPTMHGLHVGAPSGTQRLSAEKCELLCNADVILSLEFLDLGGALRQARKSGEVTGKIIATTLQEYVINGWTLDHGSLAPIDCALSSDTDQVVSGLLSRLSHRERVQIPQKFIDPSLKCPELKGEVDMLKLANAVHQTIANRKTCIMRLPSGWPFGLVDFEDPLDYIGKDGGAGIGSGPGMSIGAALGLRGTDRLPIAVMGDGNLLMAANALWSAARYRIPLLIVVANNGGYFNDVRHQDTVAIHRSRSRDNKWIGQQISDPLVDIPSLARSMGFEAPPTIDRAEELMPALEQGFAAVEDGSSYLIDVTVVGGYYKAPGLQEAQRG